MLRVWTMSGNVDKHPYNIWFLDIFFVTSFNLILSPHRTFLWTSVSKMMQRAAMHFAASWKDATGGPGSQHSLSALHLRTVQ